MSSNSSQTIIDKMNAANLSAELQHSFLRAVQLARDGDDGTITESDIQPIDKLDDFEKLESFEREGADALPHSVIIKLNGGLGTSMGLAQAKSLLPVKNNLSFLEIIAKQVMHLRNRYATNLPLITMNSFRTEADTLALFAEIPGIETGQNHLPLSFLQNKVPKIRATDFLPVTYEPDPNLEWCPPGHGDIYIALKQSGLLSKLIELGYRYAFISNADNLGASLDINLLGYFVSSAAPFMMEVANRTEEDKKGGHLARRVTDGRIILREVAQTKESDLAAFQNIAQHKYFNTNSLWINLQDLNDNMSANGGTIPLPIIVNKKTVDPTNKESTPVLQLESAMGAAIEVFEGARAIRVARNRFLPVKKTSDLLLLMSDLYVLEDNGVLTRHNDTALPQVDLDSAFYTNIADFELRFPSGVPSLLACTSLRITGDVRFGAGIKMQGDIALNAPEGKTLHIEDNTCLTGS